MCVILDADCVGEVFGSNRSIAGCDLFNWLEKPDARLVVGGKLWEELNKHRKFEKWAVEAQRSRRVRRYSDDAIATEEGDLPTALRSNDPHVIALARTSRARVLYSKDKKLGEDFRDPKLVPKPKGRLLPTGDSANASASRKELLQKLLRPSNLCPNR